VLEKADEITDDSESREQSKSAKNKEVAVSGADTQTTSKEPVEVPVHDSTGTIKVTCSTAVFLNYGRSVPPEIRNFAV